MTAPVNQPQDHDLHPEVVGQVAETCLDPNLPLIITDADEVIFAFVRGLENYLHRHDLYLRLESFALTGNIRNRHSDEVLPAEDVRERLKCFFASETHALDPVDGVAAALAALSGRAQILVLSNVPLPDYDRRITALL